MIVPTYNEAENLPLLLDRLGRVLHAIDHEIIVVDDDSPDGTWRIARDRSVQDPTVRLIRRMDSRGLSSAVLAGLDAASGSTFAVLDADLQHDEAILPDLIDAVRHGGADVAIGSREAPGGSYGDFGPIRRLLSYVGAKVASGALGVNVADPMSGYFALSARRYASVRPTVNPRGFKILLDLLASGERPAVVEIGYGFRARRHGDTKLSSGVMAAFGLSVAELAVRRATSRTAVSGTAGDRFTSYVGVVVVAACVRLAVESFLAGLGLAESAALVAIELAILVEFAGHQRLTFPVSDAPGRAREWSTARRLTTFHAVAVGTTLLQLGLGATVARILTDPASTTRLVSAFGLVTGGMMVAIASAYVLNRRLTWPSPARPSTGGIEPASAQERRPMTPSTSDAISSTARR